MELFGGGGGVLVNVLLLTDQEVNEITYLLSEDTELSKHGEQKILIRTSKSSLRLNGHHWQPGCHHAAVPSIYPRHDQPLFPAPQYPLATYPCILAAACSHVEGHFLPLMDQGHGEFCRALSAGPTQRIAEWCMVDEGVFSSQRGQVHLALGT